MSAPFVTQGPAFAKARRSR